MASSPPRPSNSAGDRRVESPASFKRRSFAGSSSRLADTISSLARRRQGPGTIELPGPGSFSSPNAQRLSKGLLTPNSEEPSESQRRVRSPGGDQSAPLPSMMTTKGPADSSPVPRTTIFVLCICMLGVRRLPSLSQLTARRSSSRPRHPRSSVRPRCSDDTDRPVFFMVEQFLTGPNGKPDESSVGLWTGYLCPSRSPGRY